MAGVCFVCKPEYAEAYNRHDPCWRHTGKVPRRKTPERMYWVLFGCIRCGSTTALSIREDTYERRKRRRKWTCQPCKKWSEESNRLEVEHDVEWATPPKVSPKRLPL